MRRPEEDIRAIGESQQGHQSADERAGAWWPAEAPEWRRNTPGRAPALTLQPLAGSTLCEGKPPHKAENQNWMSMHMLCDLTTPCFLLP